MPRRVTTQIAGRDSDRINRRVRSAQREIPIRRSSWQLDDGGSSNANSLYGVRATGEDEAEIEEKPTLTGHRCRSR